LVPRVPRTSRFLQQEVPFKETHSPRRRNQVTGVVASYKRLETKKVRAGESKATRGRWDSLRWRN